MNKFEEQEKHSQPLHDLLNTVKVPSRTESEWQLLENSLFARMDSNEIHSPAKTESRERLSWLPSNLRVPALATMLIALGLVGRFAIGFGPQTLVDSSIVGTRGTVSVFANGTEQVLKESPTLDLSKDCTIETGNQSSTTLRLGENTGILLSANSRATITKATTKSIRIRLDKGSVLASVQKRAKGQSFAVVTANARCKVVGTVFRVSLENEKAPSPGTTLQVYRGAVEFKSRELRSDEIVVQSGEMATIQGKTLGKALALAESENDLRELSLLQLALEVAESPVYAAGILDITSKPSGARVTINGNLAGHTPLVIKYPVGVYQLGLELEGYTTFKQPISLDHNKVFRVVGSMAPSHEVFRNSDNLDPRRSRRAARRRRLDGTEDLNNPEYIEALIQMTVGEYRKALTILDKLKDSPDLSRRQRTSVLQKVTQCYSSLGDFGPALRNLEQRFKNAATADEKSQILWEMATVRSTCLGDYRGAAEDLTHYLDISPKGPWADQARIRLGDVQYLLSASE